MTPIGALMKTEMVTARVEETVAHAAWSMARNGVGALLILEGEKLVGERWERDVVERVVAEGRSPESTLVSDVATRDVVTVDVSVPVRECADLLREKNIRHLPVTRDGKPAGILSSRDFLAYVAEGLERLVDRSRYEKALAEGDDPYDHLGGSFGK